MFCVDVPDSGRLIEHLRKDREFVNCIPQDVPSNVMSNAHSHENHVCAANQANTARGRPTDLAIDCAFSHC